MTDRAYSLHELCELGELSYSYLRFRSKKEGWPAAGSVKPAGGGWAQPTFTLSDLPDPIRSKVAVAIEGRELAERERRQDLHDVAAERAGDEDARRLAAVQSFEKWAMGQKGSQKSLMREYINASGLDVSVKTLGRWRKKFKGAKKAHSDSPQTGRKETVWAQEAKKLLADLYLSPNQPTATSCISRVRREAKKQCWTLPSTRTMHRFLESIPAATREFYREGRGAFEQVWMLTRLRDYSTLVPNQVWCGDHMQFDVAVKHPETGKPTFYWLTMWMDVRSRRPMGWDICEVPSSRTINTALKRGVERFGLPTSLYIDNGADYSSKMLVGGYKKFRRLTQDEQEELTGTYKHIGLERVIFAIPGNPRAKPVERMFKTIQDDVLRLLPGYRGNCTANRPENVDGDIKAGRLLDYETFEAIVRDGLEAYATRPHHGDSMGGETPDAVWRRWFESNSIRRIAPSALRLLFLPHRVAKVGKQGIRFAKQYYWHEEVAIRKGEKVLVKYDPDDLGFVDCYDLAGNFIVRAELRGRVGFLDIEGYEEHERQVKRLRKLLKDQREQFKKGTGISKRSVELAAKPEVVEQDFDDPAVTELVRTQFDHLDPTAERKRPAPEETAELHELLVRKQSEEAEEEIDEQTFMAALRADLERRRLAEEV